MSAPAPGWARALAALRGLAGLRTAPVPPAEPLPETSDLWPLCLAAAEAGHAAMGDLDRARAGRERIANAARNLALGVAADRARSLLAGARLPSLPLKGVDLLGLYASPGLRPMEDVDLLVPPGRVQEARALLAAEGYVDDPGGRPGPYAVAMRGPRALAIDLHGTLFNRSIPLWAGLTDEDPAAWWEHVRDGRLDPDARFLVVAAHAAKHWFVRDRWLADLVLTWTDDVEPRRLVRLARRQGLVPLLRLALEVLDRSLGVPVPAGLLRGLGPVTAEGKLLVEGLARGVHDFRDRRLARFLPMVPGLAKKLRVLRATLLPGPAEAQARFGSGCYPAFLVGRLAKALGFDGERDGT